MTGYKDLANALRNVAGILDFFNNVKDMTTCNDCGNLECEYRPQEGELVRMNCMFWQKQKEREAENEGEGVHEEQGRED